MIIKEIAGNRKDLDLTGLQVDVLELEWFETVKRIQRKKTVSGMEIAMKFLKEGLQLREGDVLFKDDVKAVTVHVKPCDAIVVRPASMLEMGTICYEIGNKHLPVFIQDEQVLIPYEHPLFHWLEASGYKPVREERQLLNLLKSNVSPHSHGHEHGHEHGHGSGSSLFNRIINLASKV